MNQVPTPTARRPRAAEIVAAARSLLEDAGFDAISMRTLADQVGIRAPSLYKHFPSKEALKAALVEQGLTELGTELHRATARKNPLWEVLAAYRKYALAHPNLYRLGTAGRLPRDQLAPGVEEWAGEPFYLATGDPSQGQALWAFAHGMVILELDQRFWEQSDLDQSWAAGADAFAGAGPLAQRRTR